MIIQQLFRVAYTNVWTVSNWKETVIFSIQFGFKLLSMTSVRPISSSFPSFFLKYMTAIGSLYNNERFNEIQKPLLKCLKKRMETCGNSSAWREILYQKKWLINGQGAYIPLMWCHGQSSLKPTKTTANSIVLKHNSKGTKGMNNAPWIRRCNKQNIISARQNIQVNGILHHSLQKTIKKRQQQEPIWKDKGGAANWWFSFSY